MVIKTYLKPTYLPTYATVVTVVTVVTAVTVVIVVTVFTVETKKNCFHQTTFFTKKLFIKPDNSFTKKKITIFFLQKKKFTKQSNVTKVKNSKIDNSKMSKCDTT